MFRHKIKLGKDSLTADAPPLDEDSFYSMLDRDAFEVPNSFRYYPIEFSSPELQEKYSGLPEIKPSERFNTKVVGNFRFGETEVRDRPSIDAVQLYWSDVRVEVHKERRKLGEWVAYAWGPVTNELYVFGRDFIPDALLSLSTTPEGRGRPNDHLITGANCGPSAVAAYLNKSTSEVIDHLPVYKKNGWTNPPHVIHALEEFKIKHNHVQYTRADGENLDNVTARFGHGLAFIQYVYGKNEKISHTHWIAFDVHRDRGPVVYDVNVFDNIAYGKGNWVPIEMWNNGVEPLVRDVFLRQSRYKKFDGYFVRDVISLKK